MMVKTYRKDGNSTGKGLTYCKKHFIKLYGRDPNINDTAYFSTCPKCCNLLDGI